MRPVHEFLRLSLPDQYLLLQAALLVSAIRVGLWVVPFRTLHRLLAHVSRGPVAPASSSAGAVDRITWAVGLASHYIPRATCLTQALATQVLLRRYGHTCKLHIGVARGSDARLEAHAWVEYAGRVVIGGPRAHIARYTPLPSLEGRL